jgi:hypothetical protein
LQECKNQTQHKIQPIYRTNTFATLITCGALFTTRIILFQLNCFCLKNKINQMCDFLFE